ncbi:unnamed protein product [Symbiodinium necroappetens]|uniref:Uncharacterized protein n=1 Tax=Symbiodinium necroappetens TaxID=1628268 RepID=A0A813B6H7_9DINO|nr:unnamed protein product [Symbiodinium necroappetens]
MAGRGRGRGMAHVPEAPDPNDSVIKALLQLQEDGDLTSFLEVAAVDLNQDIAVAKYRKTTPFDALLNGLRKSESLATASGLETIRLAVSLGAQWTVPSFLKLLRGLIELRAVNGAQGRELLDFALQTGARWDPGEDEPVSRDEVAFQAMVPLLLEAELLDEPASMELLERSLAECRLQNVMGVRLEGGGNIFSHLVGDAVCWGVLGTPKGDALIDLAMAHGADWASLDGWSLTPFEEIPRLALRRDPKHKTPMSPEAALAYARKVLQGHPQPGLLWNGTRKTRTEEDPFESQGALLPLLRTLAEQKRVGEAISRKWLKMADETGAKWDAIHWKCCRKQQVFNLNLMKWKIWQIGRVSTFHSLVQDLAVAGALDHPDGVDIVARALENGADYRIDDPEPPGPKRLPVDIPELVWSWRRETVRLLALLASGRAVPKSGDLVASLVALAQFVQGAAHASALQVRHPIVESILGFLPRVPPVLGYEFTGYNEVAHHPQPVRC